MAGGKLISTGVEFPDATTQTTSGLPLTGGALTGAVTTTSTFDGRDVAADGVTADAALPKAGGTMTGTIAGFTSTGIDDNATSTAITIDASENVGINNTSPSSFNSFANDLVIGDGTLASGLTIYTSPTTKGALNFADGTSGSSAYEAYIEYDHIESQLVIRSNYGVDSNPKFTIKANADVEIGKGNLVIGTSGKGIDFSATSDGSGTMTSEVLDDYEEGTWTPVLEGAVTAGDYTYDTTRTSGRYTKVGNLVTVNGAIRVSTVTTAGAGAAYIVGLPFAPLAPTSYPRRPGSCLMQSGFTSTGSVFVVVQATAAHLGLYEQTTTSISNIDITNADLVNSVYAFSMTYDTA